MVLIFPGLGEYSSVQASHEISLLNSRQKQLLKMPFPTDEELFKCVGCPCCFEGFACSPFGNCCAIRLESIFECDPVRSKNCFFDQRIQSAA